MDTIVAKGTASKPRIKPPEGSHQAVLVDVIDLGMHENIFNGENKGLVHKCALVWQLDAENPETNKRFEISKEFTVSMGEKANLRKFLGAWRGKSYSDQEAEEGAPLHKLEGVNGIMQIEHKQSKSNPDRTYANIVSLVPLMKSVERIVPENYQRADFWKEQIAKPENIGNAPADQDDDLPF